MDTMPAAAIIDDLVGKGDFSHGYHARRRYTGWISGREGGWGVKTQSPNDRNDEDMTARSNELLRHDVHNGLVVWTTTTSGTRLRGLASLPVGR